MMTPVRDSRMAVTAWAVLMVLTVLSVALGIEGGGIGGTGAHAAAVAVIVLAFVKVRLIGRYFMELRCAPLWLSLAFDAYVVVVGATLSTIYLATT
jgi:hypothetical protein